MSSRSHIRPMASPTRPRPMMATVCPGPPPDVDARHLTEVILGALGRRMLGSSATDVGEPAVDIARAPAGRRGARRPKVPTQQCEIASKPNRSLSFCGPNFEKKMDELANPADAPLRTTRPRFIASSLRSESRSSTSTERGPVWFDPSAGGRAYASFARSKSGKNRRSLARALCSGGIF